MTLRRLHLVVGIVGILAFLATGQYMDKLLGHLVGYDDTTRMLYRSTHLYLLLSAGLNLLLGLYLEASPEPLGRALQRLGSLLILLGPALFAVGFFVEPGLRELARPWSRPALYAAFAGLLAHLAARVALRAPAPQDGEPLTRRTS